MPSNSAGPAEVIRLGQVHLDRMAPVPEMAPYVERFLTVQNAFVSAVQGWENAIGAVRSAMTHRKEKSAALYGAVQSFFTAVKNKTHRRRNFSSSDPYFPDGFAPFGPTLATLIQQTGIVLAKLGEETDPVLTAHIEPITTAMNETIEAVTALEASRAAARAARGVLLAERRDWDIAYRRNYYDLRLFYHGIRDQADSFFWHPIYRDRTPEQPEANLPGEDLEEEGIISEPAATGMLSGAAEDGVTEEAA